MATRLYSTVIDANDLQRLSSFWREALGWQVVFESDDEVALVADPDAPAFGLVFVPVPEPKSAQNRIHLDLASESEDDQRAIVERLEGMGATRIDIGQGDVPWVVLADPEGNEFCVLEPRDEYRSTGALAAVVVAAEDPASLGAFWAEAAGWPVTKATGGVALRPPAMGVPYLEFIKAAEPKQVKNRFHLDVAPEKDVDQDAEAARLEALGARRIDIGQGDQSWIVLADPEGQEFCILSPR